MHVNLTYNDQDEIVQAMIQRYHALCHDMAVDNFSVDKRHELLERHAVASRKLYAVLSIMGASDSIIKSLVNQ